jgi:transcriptional regulator with XRE-family HTH domain
MNSMNLKIREIIEYYQLSERQFSIKIGVNPTVINSMFKKGNEPSAKVIQLIATAFPEISLDWFVRGEGDMFNGMTKDMERINSLLDTISTLQDTINIKSDTIAALTAQIRKYEAMKK